MRPANVSLDEDPSGRRNSSNFDIAPEVRAKSRAWRTCVLASHAGPSTCRAISLHAAVLPTPGGPESRRCGGFAWTAVLSMVDFTASGSKSSLNRTGAFVASQLDIICHWSSAVFQPCAWQCSLCDKPLGTVASEFHEDSRSACLATDSVSLAMERFEASTHCTFVIDEFNHSVRLRFIRPASLS